jgi:serine/threonine protein kinase
LPADASAGEPGGQLGKYQLIRRLATGGMAELFLARAKAIHGFEKLVVLKRILPQHAENDDFIRMFLAEARLAATLHHPNIVQVYDIGGEEGSYFFTMEFVQGVDLRKLVRAARKKNKALPLEHILHVIMGMAAGLNHAHEKVGLDGKMLGIVHRDVSPSNVLVTFEGGVKIVDFGIAKAASAQVATIAGTLKGKIPYMSPEQCRGESVDRRSDIFSIGTLLWELTTGTRLFAGDNEFAVLNRVAKGEVPPPSSIRPDYPPELEAIVMKALQSDPVQRYGTALDLQIDLEDFAREARLPVSSARLAKFMKDLCAEDIARLTAQLGVESDDAATVPQPILAATAVVTPAANDPGHAIEVSSHVESGMDLTPSELRGGVAVMPTPGPGDLSSSVTEVPFDSIPGRRSPAVAVAIVAGVLAIVGLGGAGWYVLEGRKAGDAPKAPASAPTVLVAPDPIDDPDEQEPPPKAPAAADEPAKAPGTNVVAPDPEPPEAAAPEDEIVVDDEDPDAVKDDTSPSGEPEAAKDEEERPRPKSSTRGRAHKSSTPKKTPPKDTKKPKWDPNVGIPGL